MYSKFIHPDITFNILSNYQFYFADIEKDFFRFNEKLDRYDMGIWINRESKTDNIRLNDKNIKIYNSSGEVLNWPDIVLNYLQFLNTFMREQIGVCIDRQIPRIIDNELTYLIIQRKEKKDFSDMLFIAVDGEVVFPMIKKEHDTNLALIKLAEWKNRAGFKNLVKFQY